MSAVFYEGKDMPAASPDQPPTPGGSVALTLSDGRTMTLHQTISADGGRYANTDESFVFWSKGNGALVLEDNQEKSYVGCIALAPLASGSDLTQTYSNSGDGFSIRLPQGYTANESYQYQELGPGKNISGVAFTIPASIAKGTNLSSDTYLSVEELPKLQSCDAKSFLGPGVKSYTMTEGNTTYSVASSTGAAAGNRYAETVYAIPGTSPCIAVRYSIHFGVFENYPPGAVTEFDQAALTSKFDSIRRTLIVVQ